MSSEDLTQVMICAREFSEDAINHLLYSSEENICWLCMAKENGGNFVSIYDNIVVSTDTIPSVTTIKSILKTLLGEEIEFSELPHTVCTKCTNKFIQNYLFMNKCLQRHEHWKGIGGIANEISQVEIDNSQAHMESELGLEVDEKIFNLFQDKTKLSETTIICPHCSKSINYNDFKEHMSVMHSNLSQITCEKCLKTFINQRSYLTHSQKCSRKGELWCCKSCKIHFKTERKLLKHKQKECRGYSCRFCNKLLLDETLESHKSECILRKITKRRPAQFKCKHCNIEYTTRSKLTAHVNRLHRPRNKPCPKCGNLFKTTAAVNDHMKVHNEDKKFTCDYCMKKFVNMRTLENHIRLHINVKPYKCFFCAEAFVSNSRRLEHLRKQHWEPQFECDVCSKKFSTPFALKAHRTRHFAEKNNLDDVKFKRKTLAVKKIAAISTEFILG